MLNHNPFITIAAVAYRCIFCLYNEHIQSIYGLATTPNGRNKKFGCYKRHENLDMLAKRLHHSVLLIGDLIVAGPNRYQTVWKKYFNPYKALNCGIP